MNCPKCQGTMVYEAPHYEGDTASARCLNCGNRIWEPVKVAMPEIPKDGGHGRPAMDEAGREAARLHGILRDKLRRDKLRAMKRLGEIRQMEAAL